MTPTPLNTYSSTPGESPPPPLRECFGRDDLIEDIARDAEQLKPTALVGFGGMGKTVIALAILHHERILGKFSDQRRFIRCDEFTTSLEDFLGRLSAVIGTGLGAVTSFAPIRKFIQERRRPIILVLDNAETILDSRAPDASKIRQVVKELSQFPNLCLIVTSRIDPVLPGCEPTQVLPLSLEDGRKVFYGIYRKKKLSNAVDDLLKQLDYHPLSITILAQVSSQNSWGYEQILREWEGKKSKILETDPMDRDQCLAASIEVSLGSPTFKALGDQAREVLEVIAFFPQGINWKELDWLFPEVTGASNMIDKFCALSLVSRPGHRVTMLAPLREYLRREDSKPGPLIRDVKERYFSRLRPMDENLRPDMPGFSETRWILTEESNVERLLEAFQVLEPEAVMEAYANFLLHLSWHYSFDASEERSRFLGSFGARVLRFSDKVLGQRIIDHFDEVGAPCPYSYLLTPSRC